ncbi:hypothetical protein M3D75_14495 [Microbacterium enclense]|uniref:hypothetical protein n=1 Tax=Microbacterium enclense TaxID=993073 RepID=UPI0021A8F4AD|nr:hypothetical protein [Microbacterium enclense]MCT2087329.1 hypothetical protein [Microbacterium enclense]
MTNRKYGELFSDALVSEIKAEMGRQDLSSRALGRLIGKSSQYMSDRLDGGSPKTGRRVLLNVTDLAAIAEALGIRTADLTLRAHHVALGVDPSLAMGGNVIPGKFGVRAPGDDELRAVARPADPEPTDEQPSYDDPN